MKPESMEAPEAPESIPEAVEEATAKATEAPVEAAAQPEDSEPAKKPARKGLSRPMMGGLHKVGEPTDIFDAGWPSAFSRFAEMGEAEIFLRRSVTFGSARGSGLVFYVN